MHNRIFSEFGLETKMTSDTDKKNPDNTLKYIRYLQGICLGKIVFFTANLLLSVLGFYLRTNGNAKKIAD